MGVGNLTQNSNALAADARSLNSLKLQAGQNTPAAIKEAAKQFESLFMRELIKSMREATMKSGMLESAQGDLGTDLLDQQLAVQMSGRPGGLSDIIAQQLSRQMGVGDAQGGARPANRQAIQPAAGVGNATPTVSQTSFVQRFNGVAAKVEQSSGIPASFMIGQAGHETGWGRHEIKNTDGSTSFNLFGIKAGAGWKGKVAEVTTTEYVNGVPQKTVAKFRAYNSYEESFRDYARLISDSPRYAQVRQQTGSVQAYASGLQRAGYATDPDYANKLSRAINTTLRLQRATA
ncbi:MAG: flagellar rod assembly protein/muramidase FlgJ [Curvibacter sp. GWA2_64_110]|nr:MAG: flagellar rod assembly protein/muramidase FlgJ [Curvibacter sp. GWA2_64_110]HCY17553.1 flagellar assembly peptidoglycan hydrolase FlgJ [Curvibacter sp.]